MKINVLLPVKRYKTSTLTKTNLAGNRLLFDHITVLRAINIASVSRRLEMLAQLQSQVSPKQLLGVHVGTRADHIRPNVQTKGVDEDYLSALADVHTYVFVSYAAIVGFSRRV
jgi:hypothetical protein